MTEVFFIEPKVYKVVKISSACKSCNITGGFWEISTWHILIWDWNQQSHSLPQKLSSSAGSSECRNTTSFLTYVVFLPPFIWFNTVRHQSEMTHHHPHNSPLDNPQLHLTFLRFSEDSMTLVKASHMTHVNNAWMNLHGG